MFDAIDQHNVHAISLSGGPDQLTSGAYAACVSVNLFGYEANYRARGGHSLDGGDCTRRRPNAMPQVPNYR